MIVWLGKVTGGANAAEFTSISQSYERLIITANYRSADQNQKHPKDIENNIIFNGNTSDDYATTLGGNYAQAVGYSGAAADDKWTVYGDGVSVRTRAATSYQSSTNMMCLWLEIHNYTGSAAYQKKGVQGQFGTIQTGNNSGYNYLQYEFGAVSDAQAAITTIKFSLPGGDNYVGNSYWNLYGVSNTN